MSDSNDNRRFPSCASALLRDNNHPNTLGRFVGRYLAPLNAVQAQHETVSPAA